MHLKISCTTNRKVVMMLLDLIPRALGNLWVHNMVGLRPFLSFTIQYREVWNFYFITTKGCAPTLAHPAPNFKHLPYPPTFHKLKAISRKFTLLRAVNLKISLRSSNRIGLYTNRKSFSPKVVETITDHKTNEKKIWFWLFLQSTFFAEKLFRIFGPSFGQIWTSRQSLFT